jgi:hypothetical protein
MALKQTKTLSTYSVEQETKRPSIRFINRSFQSRFIGRQNCVTVFQLNLRWFLFFVVYYNWLSIYVKL